MEGQTGEPEFSGYSPSEALAREEEERQHGAELSEMRGALDADYRQAVEEARNRPPPATVLAYREVYGSFPAGWPPWEALDAEG